MDGSPQRGSLHATTLWHFDAAEWAPSTASLAPVVGSGMKARMELSDSFEHLRAMQNVIFGDSVDRQGKVFQYISE